ncbi:hypothetical protein Droror1_Dr00004195 [Drosera rotundifolia]
MFCELQVGNPLLDYEIDTGSTDYDFLWSHALISDETHSQILEVCTNYSDPSTECNHLQAQAIREVGNPDGYVEEFINLYDIYAPVCLDPALKIDTIGSVDNYDPCSTNYVNSYLNLREVQEAFHAKPTNWSICSR